MLAGKSLPIEANSTKPSCDGELIANLQFYTALASVFGAVFIIVTNTLFFWRKYSRWQFHSRWWVLFFCELELLLTGLSSARLVVFLSTSDLIFSLTIVISAQSRRSLLHMSVVEDVYPNGLPSFEQLVFHTTDCPKSTFGGITYPPNSTCVPAVGCVIQVTKMFRRIALYEMSERRGAAAGRIREK